MNFFELFDRDACLAAIRGQAVPNDLRSGVARSSVIAGIRSHYKFATDAKVQQLCDRHPEFARARNARLIMSNELPEGLADGNAQPYCIWYPDLASEDTYRQLACRFPSMRYHVGRACAAAGYTDLYDELDLLPDVSIAEEARESKTKGGRAIYRSIVSASTRYAVMNDYDRSINLANPKTSASLNGDTAVRWSLTMRLPLPTSQKAESTFLGADIEEDRKLGDGNEPGWDDKLPEQEFISIEESTLLYSPLPQDLPTIKKDILIQMAAYEGNIDRYARLMRPYHMVELEPLCVIRGIFHHTMFARWWADQVQTNSRRIRAAGRQHDRLIFDICSAINARRIMINEISTFNEHTEHLPDLIWWPLQPREDTLKRLLQRCPLMKHTIGIACIKCDYQDLYKSLDLEPHYHFKLAAEQSPNPFYLQDITTRAAELGITLQGYNTSGLDIEESAIRENMEPTGDLCAHPMSPNVMINPIAFWGPYFGDRVDSSKVELYVWQSPELLRKSELMYGPGSWYDDLAPTVESSDEEEEKDAGDS